MKRINILASFFLMLVLTQLAVSQSKDPRSVNATCGTDMAISKMSLEHRAMTSAAAVTSQEAELLIYINFNPNGSLVRPGFGDADTLTSTLVNNARFCPVPSLTAEQQDEIVKLVSDDFSPFNIRVTADPAEFAAYPRQFKEMCLITTDPAVIGLGSGVGGVAPFAGLGLRLPANFSFAFSSTLENDPPAVAGVVSHELAHLLGLGHQHLFSETCDLLNEYHPGFGSGRLAFYPLMGNGFGEGINNWFGQSCVSPGDGAAQDDYELINSQVATREDDFPAEPTGEIVDQTEITGVLERAGDIDYVHIDFGKAGPVHITSDNIDLNVTLLKADGRVIPKFNDPESRNVVIPSAKGEKFLKIRAKRNENMRRRFMTGSYHISY